MARGIHYPSSSEGRRQSTPVNVKPSNKGLHKSNKLKLKFGCIFYLFLVAAEWLAMLLRIWRVWGSNPGMEIGYPPSGSSWFSQYIHANSTPMWMLRCLYRTATDWKLILSSFYKGSQHQIKFSIGFGDDSCGRTRHATSSSCAHFMNLVQRLYITKLDFYFA